MFKDIYTIMFDADTGSTGGTVDGKDDIDSDIDSGTDDGGTTDEDTTKGAVSQKDIEKMIQSAEDRIRGEYSKKLREKDTELNTLRQESMSDEERAQDDAQKLMAKLKQREAELEKKELTLKTIDLLKANDLPLETKDFLISDSEENTLKNIESFKVMFDTALSDAVTEKFKKSGKKHEGSTGHVGRFTQEDIAKMTSDEINKNWEKIERDLS